MAESSDQHAQEMERLLSLTQNIRQPWYVRARRYCTPQFRSVRSKGAMLVANSVGLAYFW